MSGFLPAEVDRVASGTLQLQAAASGWFEHAQVAQLPLASEEVDRLLDAAGAAEVAVELLWSGPPIVFVGTIVGPARRPRVYQAAASGGWAPSEVLEILTGGAAGRPVRATIGVVTAWRTVEPLPLPLEASVWRACFLRAAGLGRTSDRGVIPSPRRRG
jgi:hypothetical protein